MQVTFLQVTKKHRICEEIVKHNHQPRLILSCLKPRHFQPEVIETFPDEQVSHAVLAWLRERGNKCDVLHGHEWGGAFVDAITAVHYRQLRPGLRFAVEPHGGHIWWVLASKPCVRGISIEVLKNSAEVALCTNSCDKQLQVLL